MSGYGQRKARETAATYGTYDVDSLCDTLHIDVIEAPISPLIGYLGYDNYRAYIVVNSSLPGYIKYYVVAHELGHHIMHPHDIGYYWIVRNTLFRLERLESDANDFAVSLLGMPESVFSDVRAYLHSVG